MECCHVFMIKTCRELSNCFNEKRQWNSIIKIILPRFISVNSHIKAAHYILLIKPRIIEPYFKMQEYESRYLLFTEIQIGLQQPSFLQHLRKLKVIFRFLNYIIIPLSPSSILLLFLLFSGSVISFLNTHKVCKALSQLNPYPSRSMETTLL